MSSSGPQFCRSHEKEIAEYNDAYNDAYVRGQKLETVHAEFVANIPVSGGKVREYDKDKADTQKFILLQAAAQSANLLAATSVFAAAGTGGASLLTLPFILALWGAGAVCNAKKDKEKRKVKELFEKELVAREEFLDAFVKLSNSGQALLAASPEIKINVCEAMTVATAVATFPVVSLLLSEGLSEGAVRLLIHMASEHPVTTAHLAMGAAGGAFDAAVFLGPDIVLSMFHNAAEIASNFSLFMLFARAAFINEASPDAEAIDKCFNVNMEHYEKIMLPLIRVFQEE